MAKLSTLFDATKVAPQAPRIVIPKGKYPAQITASEMKPTKDTKGSYLQLQVTVMDGEHKGHNLFTRLNLKNASAKAVEIAQAELSAICHATGVMKVQDSIALHNKPVIIAVGVEEAQYKKDRTGNLTDEIEFDEKNEIRGWEPLDGAAPGGGSAEAPAFVKAKGAPAPAAAPAEEPAAPAEEQVSTTAAEGQDIFYVQVGEEVQEHNAAAVFDMLKQGMPVETPVCREGDDGWKTAADYGIVVPKAAPKGAPTPKGAPATAKKVGSAPWLNKK